ncbi:hypothetical protein KC207_04995 [Phycicoccus sp. BSK3Z-2]|uniref:Uncharacterized protein n=1 Tax=Phycicoccus avicenniae TaxID=2828860 RepID=A0A941HY74_9MICO|nr:hypothetical protein [Phycicoccus avicenniae]MBR7742643.1 hypothetical protein [Phycicoccus avicenniae]
MPSRLSAAAIAAALALAGCSGESASSPSASPTLTIARSPTPTSAGPTADFVEAPEYRPLATTTAREGSSYSGATFEILRLESDERSTLLVWSATHPRTVRAGSDFDVRLWESFPVLNTKRKAFSVLTYETPTGETQCVCVDMRAMRAEPNPQGAMYPPLPENVTSVTLTSPWFGDVTVPVTRS